MDHCQIRTGTLLLITPGRSSSRSLVSGGGIVSKFRCDLPSGATRLKADVLTVTPSGLQIVKTSTIGVTINLNVVRGSTKLRTYAIEL